MTGPIIGDGLAVAVLDSAPEATTTSEADDSTMAVVGLILSPQQLPACFVSQNP